MASVFSTSLDNVIRNGDYAIRVPGASSNDPNKSASRGANTSANPTAQAFGVDTTSLDNWWDSMTDGTWLNHVEEETLVGAVKSVDLKRGVAVLTVWMKGNKCVTEGKRKPEEVCKLQELKKLSKGEFNQICKKEYMQRAAYQLKLRGEGYDESAPFALIAHNNRLVSGLIDRIDTSSHFTHKDLVRRRPKGPAAVKQLPTPVVIPVEDPLAEVRGELEALAAGGAKSSKKQKKGDRDTGDEKRRSEEEDREVLASNVAPAFNVNDAGTSYVEDSIMHESRAALMDLGRKLDRVRQGALSTLRSQHLPRSAYDLHRDPFDCSVGDTLDDGRIEFLPGHPDVPVFFGRLRSVVLFRPGNMLSSSTEEEPVNPVDRLRELRGSTMTVSLIEAATDGTPIVDAVYEGESLQEMLVREGLAVISEDLFDNATTLFGADVANKLDSNVQPRRIDLSRLKQAQQRACAAKVGRWAMPQSNANFLPLQESMAVEQTKTLAMDSIFEEGEALPSLFTAFESSNAFQFKLLTAATKN